MPHKVENRIEVPVYALMVGDTVTAVALHSSDLLDEFQRNVGVTICGIVPGVMTLPTVTK